MATRYRAADRRDPGDNRVAWDQRCSGTNEGIGTKGQIDLEKFRYIECAQSATLIEGRELPSTRTVDVEVGQVADVDQIEGLQNEVFFTEARQELFVVIQSVVTRRGPYVTVVTFTGGGPSTAEAMAGLASYGTTRLPS